MTNEPTMPPRDAGDQLHDRMEAFGREAQAAGERFGRQAQVAGERFGKEAQAAGERLARDPAFVSAGTWIVRVWGLVLIGIGLWFFAEVDLGVDLPTFDWDLIWPLVLIVVGGSILVSGLARRR
jgi:hypothetical protein